MRIERSHFVGDRDAVERARIEFSERRCAVFPGFLASDLAERFMRHLATASWITKSYSAKNGEFGKDLVLQSQDGVVQGLQLLLNNALLFDSIQEITGCPRPSCFMGRVYRHMPDSGHHLDWHNDTLDTSRLIGLSLNLAEKPYRGGIFRIRSAVTGGVLGEVSHSEPGGAHIFQIGQEFEHSVSEIQGDIPRTAFAGWFHSLPGYLGTLRSRLQDCQEQNHTMLHPRAL